MLAVEVWRGQAEGQFESFRVPRRDSQTVLDVVTWIQRHIDPTLTYRFACRVGVCGSCAMTVNGKPRWTCRTHVSKVARDDKVTIAPLRNMPIVKDLACDMAPFFDKWARAGGRFRGAATRKDDFARVSPSSPARRQADAGIECIGCGVCYASCDVVTWNRDYLGPAALNRAWTLLNDERHEDQAGLMSKVTTSGGCYSCHTLMTCTELCPKKLSPTRAIAGLKRATWSLALSMEAGE